MGLTAAGLLLVSIIWVCWHQCALPLAIRHAICRVCPTVTAAYVPVPLPQHCADMAAVEGVNGGPAPALSAPAPAPAAAPAKPSAPQPTAPAAPPAAPAPAPQAPSGAPVAVSLPSAGALSGGVPSSASPEELAQYCKACADCTKCKDCAICATGEQGWVSWSPSKQQCIERRC